MDKTSLPCAQTATVASATRKLPRSTLIAFQQLFDLAFVVPAADQAHVYRGDTPIPVDNKGCRERVDTAIELGDVVITHYDSVVHLPRRQIRLHGFPAFIVHCHAEHGKSTV